MLSSEHVEMGENDKSDSESEFTSSDNDTSDDELREAFARGLIKPGLNEVIVRDNKPRVYRVEDIKAKMREIQLGLAWVETMDLVNKPAHMAPEVAIQMQNTVQKQINIRENNAKLPNIDIKDDPILNEFKRETLFHRQAQACVIEGIQRLNKLGIVTKRPDIYFAEMAKSDDHMQKVRQNLMSKQAGQARAEKVRQLRQQKKMGKQIQAQTKVQRANEKREALNQIKKIRKGARDNDDKKVNTKAEMKRKMKNSKYGFGGRKKGMKINTKESSNDFGDYKSKGSNKGKSSAKGNVKGKGGGGGLKKRLGKSRRQTFKSKNKK